ncbi:hypothetical protein ACFOY5_08155 [Massilia aurea]|uniref:hypothetical protein n=1 Tax=Massilia aurea TaxID=373040 RepID=UPI002163BDDF|nr:hypothetical protein [Massilia aurea]MCS0708563.1 hypothetical protein [Massilia aurea]
MKCHKKLKALVDEYAKRGNFDTHDVIIEYKTRCPVAYEADLTEVEQRPRSAKARKKTSAVHRLHTSLGIRIARICTASGLVHTQSRSVDLNGQHSRCLAWANSCSAS